MSGYHLCMKFIVIGDSGVGKSCIASRFTKEIFDNDSEATVGAEYSCKILEFDGIKIKIQIWDTAGQERYAHSITKSYYRGSCGVLIVFDISRRETFEHVENWLKNAQENCLVPTMIPILVGNKCDLEEREVSEEESKALAKKYDMIYIEASAKTSFNIDHAFLMAAREIIWKLRSNQVSVTINKSESMDTGIYPGNLSNYDVVHEKLKFGILSIGKNSSNVRKSSSCNC